ncbi:UBC-like protein [Acaromyces ingoldii]|uniref:Ubiquitin-conjugating enzyme E2 6 n=1 Tax=Acaromyces ingoldii TaxID=215250 RepID=A0A316YWF2_9BASI|nr:UBC-like protein [Acaromyces ingoldii]PWN92998.1 UBC-like protein [Acaromyces ingoldii]
MATKAGAKRLGKEAQMMDRDPPPYCYARPREDNVLEWHFILRGPPDTPYFGGEYWGQLIFPSDYPFKPPGIKVSTPSGRFHTDTKICTSMSDFHPGSWNPAWSVANILVGLLSFMCADEMTTGSVMVSPQDRKTLAARSHAFNIQQRRFKQLFPEYSGEGIKDLPNMGEVEKTPSSVPKGNDDGKTDNGKAPE